MEGNGSEKALFKAFLNSFKEGLQVKTKLRGILINGKSRDYSNCTDPEGLLCITLFFSALILDVSVHLSVV
jgi:hypothetical protein